MPLAPDAPFPKAPGNAIKSKDWNDAVNEVIRLDNDKVNRAGADAMAGPLTIATALGVGTTLPRARLHVVDSANPAVARVQSTASFGAARVEMWSDPQGGGNEWRPGYVESMSDGNYTGGLKLVTNGAGSANKTGAVEGLRVVNGKAWVGGVPPAPPDGQNSPVQMDVNGQMRVHKGVVITDSSRAECGYVGVEGSNLVLYGRRPGWPENKLRALKMDTDTGVVTCDRIWDQKYAVEACARNPVSTTSAGLTTIEGMSLTFTLPYRRNVWVLFHLPGVQFTGSDPRSHGHFILWVDKKDYASAWHWWPSDPENLRSVFLSKIFTLAAGTHTVEAAWATGIVGMTIKACSNGQNFNEYRTLQVFEL